MLLIFFYAFDREMLNALGRGDGSGHVSLKTELLIEKELKELIFVMPLGERIAISPSFLYESKVCRDILRRNVAFIEKGLIVKYMQELSDSDFREKKQMSYKKVMDINTDYSEAYMSENIFREVRELELERAAKNKRVGLSSRDIFLPEVRKNSERYRIPQEIVSEVQKITEEAREDTFLWEAEEYALQRHSISQCSIQRLGIREAMSRSYLQVFSEQEILIPASFVGMADRDIACPQYNAWILSNVFQRIGIEKLICDLSAEKIIELRLYDSIQMFLEIIRTAMLEGIQVEDIAQKLSKMGNVLTTVEKILKKDLKEEGGNVMPEDISIKENTKKLLHLSDLHLSDEVEMNKHYNHLKIDLIHVFHLKKVDFLVISGDICDRPKAEQYEVAVKFMEKICADFSVDKDRVVVIPGNHDCDWNTSKAAYDTDGKVIVDKTKYSERYKLFSNHFYMPFFGEEYPAKEEKQWRECRGDNVCILGLNSCFQIDHVNTERSSISMDAIFDSPILMDDTSLIRLAVWHHPIYGEGSISETDFLDSMAVAGFKAFFHGHIHEATNQNFCYDDSHSVRAIGAGTFGAKKGDRPAGIPLQYNLVEIDVEKRNLIVHTRKREKENKPWEADARWGDKGHLPKSSYLVEV